MKNKKSKKLNLKKCTISNLDMNTIKGGVVHSCIPICNADPFPNPTNPNGKSGNFECENFTNPAYPAYLN